MTKRISSLVIGLGNRFRRDDGVGLHVSNKIKSLSNGRVEAISGIADAAALIGAWSGVPRVYLVDAVISNAEPGTIYRFDALKDDVPAEIFTGFSTHSFSVVDAVELAKTLGELPDSLILYCIEGSNFDEGVGLSPEVIKAAVKVIVRINNEIEGII